MKNDLFVMRDLLKLIKSDDSNDVMLFSLLLSSLVYFSDEFIYKHLKCIGIERNDIFINENEDNFKMLYVYHNATGFVAYRGTLFSKWANIKKVFNFIPRKNKNGLNVHRGFLMAFNDCNKILEPIIKDSNSLVFTGHSLGGALALLSAEYYNKSAITFASPNVFFREKLGDKITHLGYRIKGDIVPELPPTLFFAYWSRCKVEIPLNSSKKFLNMLKYHSLSNYIINIKERYETYKFKKTEAPNNTRIK